MVTKRTSAAAARRVAKSAAHGMATALAPEVEARIDAYTPQKIDSAVWEAARLTVVEIVVASVPASPEHAQHRMLPVAKLAAWAHSQGVPLDAATLLSERVVEEWARQALAAGEPKSSVATYRSTLRTVAAAVAPGPGPVKPTVTISRTTGAVPYTAAEERSLRRAVTGQRTLVYRKTGCLLYGLARGAGLGSSDLRSRRVADVVDHGPDGIEIDVGDRSVWVLEELCDVTRIGLAVDRGDGWLLAGRDGQRRNIGEYIDRFRVPADAPRLNIARCRATWILDHLQRRTPIRVIRDALGIRTLTPIAELLDHLDAPTGDELRRLLRGGA